MTSMKNTAISLVQIKFRSFRWQRELVRLNSAREFDIRLTRGLSRSDFKSGEKIKPMGCEDVYRVVSAENSPCFKNRAASSSCDHLSILVILFFEKIVMKQRTPARKAWKVKSLNTFKRNDDVSWLINSNTCLFISVRRVSNNKYAGSCLYSYYTCENSHGFFYIPHPTWSLRSDNKQTK